jgi:hypothetical protein
MFFFFVNVKSQARFSGAGDDKVDDADDNEEELTFCSL